MFSTLNLTRMAVFVALALAFRAVPVPPMFSGFFRFAALPIILSGFFLGPRLGFWVGAVSDVLECILFPRGVYFPGFTLTQALTGALPALIVGNRKDSPLWISLGVLVGQCTTKLLIVPCFLLLLTPKEDLFFQWKALVFYAAVTQLFHIPIYAWVSYIMLKIFKNSSLLKQTNS